MNDEQASTSTEAHDEYVAEMTKLVDEQINALTTFISLARDRLAQQSPALASMTVTRVDQTITAATGAKTATFAITSVTDLPLEDRAALMAEGQARCAVQGPDGVEEVWVLRRTTIVPTGGDTNGSAEDDPTYAEQINDTPVYSWMREHDGGVIDVNALTQTLKMFFV